MLLIAFNKISFYMQIIYIHMQSHMGVMVSYSQTSGHVVPLKFCMNVDNFSKNGHQELLHKNMYKHLNN